MPLVLAGVSGGLVIVMAVGLKLDAWWRRRRWERRRAARGGYVEPGFKRGAP